MSKWRMTAVVLMLGGMALAGCDDKSRRPRNAQERDAAARVAAMKAEIDAQRAPRRTATTQPAASVPLPPPTSMPAYQPPVAPTPAPAPVVPPAAPTTPSTPEPADPAPETGGGG